MFLSIFVTTHAGAQSQCGGLFGSEHLESGEGDRRFLNPRGDSLGVSVYVYNFDAVAGEVWQLDAIAGDYDQLRWIIRYGNDTLASGVLDRRQTSDQIRIPETGNYCLTFEHKWERGNNVEYSFVLARLQAPQPVTPIVPAADRTLAGDHRFDLPEGWHFISYPSSDEILESGFRLIAIDLVWTETSITVPLLSRNPSQITLQQEQYQLPEGDPIVAYSYVNDDIIGTYPFRYFPSQPPYNETVMSGIIAEDVFNTCHSSIDGQILLGIAISAVASTDWFSLLQCDISLGLYQGSFLVLNPTGYGNDVLHIMAIITFPSGDAVMIELIQIGESLSENDQSALISELETIAYAFTETSSDNTFNTPMPTRQATAISRATVVPRPTNAPTQTPTPAPTVDRTLNGEIDFDIPEGWHPIGITENSESFSDSGFTLITIGLAGTETIIPLYTRNASLPTVSFTGERYSFLPENEPIAAFAYVSEDTVSSSIAMFSYPQDASYGEYGMDQIIDEDTFDTCLETVDGRVMMMIAALGGIDRISTLQCGVSLGQYRGSLVLLDLATDDFNVLHMMSILTFPTGDVALIEIIQVGDSLDQGDQIAMVGYLATIAEGFTETSQADLSPSVGQ